MSKTQFKNSARALVAAQFVLAAILVLSTRWTVEMPTARGILSIAFLIMGAGVAVWAWWSMGITRIRVMPHPVAATRLVRHGPYRWIRHPMYSGLWLATLGCLAWDFGVARLLAWLLLSAVLVAKARIEERLLQDQLAGYSQYQRQTWRFLPWLC